MEYEEPGYLSSKRDQNQNLIRSFSDQSIQLFKQVQTHQQYMQWYEQQIGSKGDLQAIRNSVLEKILNKISFLDAYTQNFTFTALEYDGQSFQVELKYGNFKKQILVLITEIEIDLELQTLGKGQYGQVYLYRNESQLFALKAINIVVKDGQLELRRVYRQFFMAYLASCFQVGPLILKFCHYDMVIMNNKAWLSMEVCQSLKSETDIKSELIQNLKVIHSFGFMHRDIKPDNLGFSKKFNRTIFLDFGFSQFVKQKLGFKTFSAYAGTLRYCSLQMKKLYQQEGKNYIDLYFNDAFCLFKTLKRVLGYNKISLLVAQKIMQEQHNLKNQDNQQEQFEIGVNKTVSYLTVIISLKFFIFSKNISKIIEILKGQKQLCSSFFLMLTNEYLSQQIQKNKEIEAIVIFLKSQMVKKSFKMSSHDQYFMKILSNSRASLCSNLLSVQHILDMPMFKMAYLLSSNIQVEKLFFLFSPFSSYFPKLKNQNMLHFTWSLRVKIIQKIFEYLEPDNKTEIFYEKVSTVTHFFYNRLGQQNNRQILKGLRAMFILLYDPIITELDIKLIKSTTNRQLKVLTYIEVRLFYKIIKIAINPKVKELRQITLEILEQNHIDPNQLKIDDDNLLAILKTKINQTQLDSKEKKEAIKNIQLLQKQICCEKNFESVRVCPEDYSQQLMHKIYSSFFNKKLKAPGQIQYQSYQFSLFCKIYQKLTISQNLLLNKKNLVAVIQKMLQISKKIGLMTPYFLFPENACYRQFQNTIFSNTELFFRILSFHQQQIYNELYFTSQIMALTRLFQIFNQIFNESKTKSQTSIILDKFILVINSFQIKLNLISSEKSQTNLIMSTILEILRLVMTQSSSEQIFHKIQDLWKIHSQIQSYEILKGFIIIINIAYPYLKKKKNFHIEKIIIQVTEACLRRENLQMFEILFNYLKLSVIAYNRLSNYERSIQIILKFISKVRWNKSYYNFGIHWYTIKETSIHFCMTAQIFFIEKKFNELRLIPDLSPQEAFLQFFLFQRTYSYLGMPANSIFKEVRRILLTFKQPHFYVKTVAISPLYQILRKNEYYRSKRKLLIALRRQGNYTTFSSISFRKLSKCHSQQQVILKQLNKKLSKLCKFRSSNLNYNQAIKNQLN